MARAVGGGEAGPGAARARALEGGWRRRRRRREPSAGRSPQRVPASARHGPFRPPGPAAMSEEKPKVRRGPAAGASTPGTGGRARSVAAAALPRPAPGTSGPRRSPSGSPPRGVLTALSPRRKG